MLYGLVSVPLARGRSGFSWPDRARRGHLNISDILRHVRSFSVQGNGYPWIIENHWSLFRTINLPRELVSQSRQCILDGFSKWKWTDWFLVYLYRTVSTYSVCLQIFSTAFMRGFQRIASASQDDILISHSSLESSGIIKHCRCWNRQPTRSRPRSYKTTILGCTWAAPG